MVICVLELNIVTIKLHGCVRRIYSKLNYVEFQKESGLKDNITISLLHLILCSESYLLLCSLLANTCRNLLILVETC